MIHKLIEIVYIFLLYLGKLVCEIRIKRCHIHKEKWFLAASWNLSTTEEKKSHSPGRYYKITIFILYFMSDLTYIFFAV